MFQRPLRRWEKSSRTTVPVIPPLPPNVPHAPVDPNPVVAICGECGIEIRQMMHYACTNCRCPCFPRVTF